jgi:hypothetical protein
MLYGIAEVKSEIKDDKVIVTNATIDEVIDLEFKEPNN